MWDFSGTWTIIKSFSTIDDIANYDIATCIRTNELKLSAQEISILERCHTNALIKTDTNSISGNAPRRKN